MITFLVVLRWNLFDTYLRCSGLVIPWIFGGKKRWHFFSSGIGVVLFIRDDEEERFFFFIA